MAVPKCPVHQSDMRQNTKGKNIGSWFCPRKNADDTWCKETLPASWVPPPATKPNALMDVDPVGALTIAAMEMAGRVYQGTGAQFEELAIDFAKRIITELS